MRRIFRGVSVCGALSSGVLACGAAVLGPQWLGGIATAAAQPQEPVVNQPPEAAPARTELLLDAADQSRPPLRHRLTFAPHEQIPGNAVASYFAAVSLKSGADWRERAEEVLGISIEDLRKRDAAGEFGFIEEHADLLKMVETATRFQRCQWDWDYNQGFGLLLPHLSPMRDLGKLVAARARVRVVRGDFDGAVSDIRVGLTLARHVGDTGFVILFIVGHSIAGMVLDVLEEMAAQPGAPNMYWPLAQLRMPLLGLGEAIDQEWQTLVLGDVVPNLDDPTLPEWSASRWQDEGERMFVKLAEISSLSNNDASPTLPTTSFTAMSLLVYPEAKAAMIARGADQRAVEAMPVARVVVTHLTEELRQQSQELGKWYWLPYWQAHEGLAHEDAKFYPKRADMAWKLTRALVPLLRHAKLVEARLEKQVAALRVVEAVRATAAQRGEGFDLGQGLVWPVPIDPFTGVPFVIRRDGDSVLIDTQAVDNEPETAKVAFTIRFRPGSKK